MPEEFNINISGLDETVEALAAMPPRIAKGAIGKALAAASVPVVAALEPRIPTLTGELRAHLVTDIAISADGKGGRAQIGFGSEGKKARLVEYGHRIIGHKPNKKDTGKQVSPHPFMRPAAEASGEESIEVFASSLRESVDEGLSAEHAA